MFTQEVIDRMDKSQVAAALKLSGLLDAETVAKLNARKDALNRPAAKTPFPKQAELDTAYDNMRENQDKIKALIAEARAGGHTYIYESQVKGVRKVSDGTPRSSNTGKRSVMRIEVGGKTYNNWREVADEHCPRTDLPRDKTNWRKIVQRANVTGDVYFTDRESWEYYCDNFKAEGWEYWMDNKTE